FETQPLGRDEAGAPVFLRDIWPTAEEVQATIDSSINREMFTSDYADVFTGDERWRALETPAGDVFEWDESSTYVRKPPYFDGMRLETDPVTDITGARVLAKLGDSVTTDHISPAGSIMATSPAGEYLAANGIDRRNFNSYEIGRASCREREYIAVGWGTRNTKER